MKKQILKTFWILPFLLCSTSFAENAAQTATTAKAQTATIQTTAAEKNKLPQFKPLHRQKPKPLLFPPMHRRQPKPPPLQPYAAENRK